MSLVSALAGLQAPTQALPRYASRYEEKCALCHVNPSGGGMRTPYASQELVPKEIAWRPTKPEILSEIDPKIGKQILIGTDFREVWLGSDDPTAVHDFFAMQADLYLAFQPDPRLTIYYDRGQSTSYEFFGLGYLTPSLYLKAGRFVPSYGWKFDDHTMFVRTELGFQPPLNSDVGLEAGYSNRWLDLQAAVVNGSRGAIQDNDKQVAGVLNMTTRAHWGPLGLALGASGYHQPSSAGRFGSVGPYASVGFHQLTWLGQADLVHREDATGEVLDGIVSSQELSWLAHRGLEFLATYDFYDPDRFHKSGAKWRWGGGVAFMPTPFVVLDGRLRQTSYDNGAVYSGREALETVLQLHLLY